MLDATRQIIGLWQPRMAMFVQPHGVYYTELLGESQFNSNYLA